MTGDHVEATLEPTAYADRLRRFATEQGWQIAWGDAAVISEVQAEIARKHSQGLFDEHVYTTMLERLTRPVDEPATGTVIIIAVPRPAHLMRFETAAGAIDAIMPPTYVDYRTLMDETRHTIASLLAPHAVRVLPVAPLKSLAVRLGLAKYGRINVTFTERTGCHHELVACLTPIDLGTSPGLQDIATQMVECQGCDACVAACPTGALADDRFLVHAERCITFANEFAGEWPEWVRPEHHTALIGCMHCIRACPLNSGKLTYEPAPVAFDQAETQALLDGKADPDDPVWRSVEAKLTAIGYAWMKASLGRNLEALIRKGWSDAL